MARLRSVLKWMVVATAVSSLAACRPHVRTPDTKADADAKMRVDRAVEGSNQLGFDLSRRLSPGANVVYSPYGTMMALALAHLGAAGETERELAEVIHHREGVHRELSHLGKHLSTYASAQGDGPMLRVVSDVWLQDSLVLAPSYAQQLMTYYGAAPTLVDFDSEPEQAREKINARVAKATHSQVPEVLPEGTVDAYTRAILTSAVYLRAGWEHPFDPQDTQERTFRSGDDEVLIVRMMHQSRALPFHRAENFDAVALPLRGGELSAMIVLPHASKFDVVARSLDARQFRRIVSSMSLQPIDLLVPQFRMRTPAPIKTVLEEMGMEAPFSPGAEFTGIARAIYLDEIRHESSIVLDEAGVRTRLDEEPKLAGVAAEAAPATRQLEINRPFLFFVYERRSGVILLLARVMDPTDPGWLPPTTTAKND